MSFEDGWSAVHLEMPARIPHTEYSIERHWDLVKVVTGIEVGVSSPPDEQNAASIAFTKGLEFRLFLGHFNWRRGSRTLADRYGPCRICCGWG